MRDRNPEEIMLNFRLLFCRAVLKLSGEKQGKEMLDAGRIPRWKHAYLFTLVLSSGPKTR